MNNVGQLLRAWRERRRLSQLALSISSGVSTRHLSYVETGRSQPSPELLLTLAETLEVPLRERNSLLVAAGYAPRFKESSWDDPDLAEARTSVERYLFALDPSPAYAVDRLWRLVVANRAAGMLVGAIDPRLVQDEVNILRVTLHPDGLRRQIRNFDEVAAHLVMRLRRQVMFTADPELEQLLEEALHYPGLAELPDAVESGGEVFIPLELEHDGRLLSFVTAMTTFGTAVDVTLAELSVETLLPADTTTADALRDISAVTRN